VGEKTRNLFQHLVGQAFEPDNMAVRLESLTYGPVCSMNVSVHPATLDLDSLLADCDTRRLRRSGPGGQHRNKVETAWWVRHRPTGVEAEANERRSQAENRRVAVFRLRVSLALDVRRPVEADFRPSPRWQSRCRAGQLHVGPGHDDFPALLAEALDVIAASECDPKAASERLECSPSQLLKLLKKEPRAMPLVNAWRAAVGLHRLQ
jgi:hypothetical protein